MTISALLRTSLAAAGLLAAAVPAFAADAAVGTFPLCYQNKPAMGGVGVKLNLMVVAPDQAMTGEATFTQAVNPPLDVTLPVKGDYTNLSTKPGKERHNITLASPDQPGRHVKLDLVATGDWKAAKGAYSLFLDTPAGTKDGKITLRQVPCGKK